MEPSAQPEPLQGGSAITYVPSLDGVRGIAILLVVWYHAPEVLRLGRIGADDLFWFLSRGGAMGVDLFFGVSGYLITSILLETKNQERSFVKFWARRALRIFPLHYLYLVVLIVVGALAPGLWKAGVTVEGAMWLPYFFYAGNIAILLMGQVGTPIIILWSLAIEEQFYLVWPFVVSRSPAREVVRLCIAGIVLTPLIRFYAQYDEPMVETSFYFSLCRVDPILWGALISYAVRDSTWRARLEKIGPHLAIPGAIASLGLWYWAAATYGRIDMWFTVVARTIAAATVASAVVLSLFPGPITKTLLELRPLLWIGRRSYGIYIWHVLLGLAIVASPLGEAFLALPGIVAFVAWTLATLVVAEVSWIAFEKPLLSFKRHFSYQSKEPT